MIAPTSLGKFGSLDWSDWAYGLISGFISGGAAAVVSGVVVAFKDPDHFNPALKFANFIELVGVVFFASGIIAAMNYLHSKPLPAMIQTETTVKRIEVEGTETKPAPPAQTITTVKETKITPAASTTEPPKEG